MHLLVIRRITPAVVWEARCDRITGKFGDVKMDDDIDEAISDVTDEE